MPLWEDGTLCLYVSMLTARFSIFSQSLSNKRAVLVARFVCTSSDTECNHASSSACLHSVHDGIHTIVFRHTIHNAAYWWLHTKCPELTCQQQARIVKQSQCIKDGARGK